MHELENSSSFIPQKVPSPLILCALDCTLYNSKLVRWAPLEIYRVSRGKNYHMGHEQHRDKYPIHTYIFLIQNAPKMSDFTKLFLILDTL